MRFEERPDVLDITFRDCISIYNQDAEANIYSYKTMELADMAVPLKEAEAISFHVKLIHE